MRAGDWPGSAGITLATLGLPVSAVLAERRRREPWSAPGLREWLARRRPTVERLDL